METLKDNEIKEITENIFKTLIKKKELRYTNRISTGVLNIDTFNWYTRTKKLKEREIENLVQFENVMSNISKCHRLMEVYNGMIENVNSKNYFANLQWYKHFRQFRQDYLYEFSKTDKLNNEWVLRQLVIDKEFLENYNIILKDRGLKVVLAKESRLFNGEKKNEKYRKYINQLMPFVTTLSEESLKKDVTTLKITTNGTIVQVDKAFLQKIVEADTEEKIAENEEKILNLALENQKIDEENENKEENLSEVNPGELKFNKYNILINLYDLGDVILFGEFDNLDNITNPSRRELDKIKKILTKKNLISLIENSIVIDNKNEDLAFEIDENRLKVSDNSRENIKNYFLELKKSEEIDYIKRVEKILENATPENIYNFFEEEINVNFTNKIYDLGISEKILIDDIKNTYADKNFVYFSVNKNLKTKYLFSSKVELVFVKNVIDKQTINTDDNKAFYHTNLLYKEIQKFFYNNNSLFPLNTIDFIIAFLHFSFISNHILRLKLKGLDNTDIKLKEEINKLKLILKPNEFNIFLELMKAISYFTEEYDSGKDIEDIDFNKRITFFKNKKNKNSYNKREVIDFKAFFINVMKLQNDFFNLFDNEFYEFKNNGNIETTLATNLEEYSRENEKISNFIYRYFIVFTIDTYINYPNKKENYKDNSYINQDEDYYSIVINKLSNLRTHIKSTDDIKEDIKFKSMKEEEIKNVNKEFEIISSPFLDFDYSIFNKNTYSNNKNRFNIVKEINAFLKTIPNISEKEFKTELKSLLKKDFHLELNKEELETVENKAINYLKEVTLFHLNLKKKNKIPRKFIIEEKLIDEITKEEKVLQKEKIVFDTIEENFYFSNIYDICYYLYLQTLVLANILRVATTGDLGFHLFKVSNTNNFEYDIVFTDEMKLKRILNLIEFSKIILIKLGLIQFKDIEKIDTEITEHFENIKLKPVVNEQIEFKNKLIEICNNPLSPFYNYIGLDIKEVNGSKIYNFSCSDLLLISTKNLDFFRYILNMSNLTFNLNKEIDTVEFYLATSDKDKKKKTLEIVINNKYDFYKYSNPYSKNYLNLKENLKNETSDNYFKYLEEYIKANKNIAFIQNFLKENEKALVEVDIPNSSFSTYFNFV